MKPRPGKHLLPWLLLLLMPCLGQTAETQLRINRETLTEGESFTLEIETHRWESGSPDLSPLAQDFEILANRRSQTFRIVQGQRKQENRWQIELLPRRAGLLRIPPIRIGSDSTPERFIEVQPAGSAPQGAARGPLPVFIEVGMEPAAPYVHAQAVYTAYLHISTQLNSISNASLSKPVPEEGAAQVDQLEGTKYEKRIGTHRYVVHELRYQVTPQGSGALRFAPLEFKAQVGGRREWVMDWSDFGLKRTGPDARTLIKRSEPLAVTVRPIPAAYPPGAQWLPARSLSLQARWAEAAPRFAPGVPVTRLFELSADGIAAAQLQLPEWNLPPAVRVYPDQPKYENSKHRQGSTGILRQGIALIPAAAGPLTLPALEVPWWNVQADRLEYARLPAETIEVAGAAPPATPPPVSAVAPALAPPAPPSSAAPAVPARPAASWWPLLSALLACAWLFTLVSWWRARRGAAGRAAGDAESTPPRPDPKPWVARLRAACLKGDPAAARAALHGWARARWPDAPPAGMAALAGRCPQLAQQLTLLDRVLYRPGSDAWHGGALWSAFRQSHKPQPAAAPSQGVLKPLYP